jgi:DNA repair protein RecN (Recombination protein N)
LKRKYGQTLAEVLEHGKSARERLSELQGREAELQKLEVESGKVNQALARAGEALRAARGKAIPKLSKLIQQQMKELGFAQSTFKIKMKPCDPAPTGMDEVEYLFAPNPGEPEKPLKEIASSGEMARVMLALKTALADQDAIPVLVFDEVDANVGGEIGERVGEKLSGIGKNHQVLCITHLPQVASQARTHFLVLKKVEKGRTFTLIERLGEQAREKEIARMLGGKAETAVKHARELLKVSC